MLFVSQALQVLFVSLSDRRLLRPLRDARDRRGRARESWIGIDRRTCWSTFSLGGDHFELTEELLRVAGGLAAFSGFYFAVAMLTDSTYREEFLDELTDEMRDQLPGARRLPAAAGAARG